MPNLRSVLGFKDALHPRGEGGMVASASIASIGSGSTGSEARSPTSAVSWRSPFAMASWFRGKRARRDQSFLRVVPSSEHVSDIMNEAKNSDDEGEEVSAVRSMSDGHLAAPAWAADKVPGGRSELLLVPAPTGRERRRSESRSAAEAAPRELPMTQARSMDTGVALSTRRLAERGRREMQDAAPPGSVAPAWWGAARPSGGLASRHASMDSLQRSVNDALLDSFFDAVAQEHGWPRGDRRSR